MPEEEYSLILFDGECNLCNGVVRFVSKNDAQNRFRFASLQSETAKTLLQQFGLPTNDMQTFVLIHKQKAYTRSDAAIQTAQLLGSPWQYLSVLRLIPQTLRDQLYNLVAQNRYAWFGKSKACPIPTPEDRKRFLS